MRLLALARLKITPDVYFGLTPAETKAMMDGEADRELLQLRQTRILATLLRNAHFKGSISEEKFMPLPGDRVGIKTPKTQKAIEVEQNAFFAAMSMFRAN